MRNISLSIVILGVGLLASNLSAAGGAACGNYLSEDGLTKGECDKAYVDATDKPSLQRGAQIYMNYCLGCHSLKYARYKKVSEDLEIPLDMFKDNLIFGDQKMGDLIQVGMDPKEAKEWFGNTPPDLTLEAGLRGPDWVYTYLKSFYIDESRPLGVNNKVYENVGMPHVLVDLQGTPQSVCRQVSFVAENGGIRQDPLTGERLTQEQCGFLEVEAGTGQLNPEEFDEAMLDLTNFLAYMTDPMKTERESIGTYTLLYLFIFTMLSYLLYREFKKDLH
ncbi:cytochrome c1 [Gammaproteobacteria bacterium]|nr:cytochrome c1 [Gammaproteobacteria bacterium]MDC0577958.1 cytochrome c1 [Gammaproteobacteria bacterium]MDC3323801.1 cytochrome c1 [Gammaproteobacteria bacterium]|tara:strand:- start:1070 stop:1900 length:831 start_codon:yes stop_codon:yes gene_type:complete